LKLSISICTIWETSTKILSMVTRTRIYYCIFLRQQKINGLGVYKTKNIATESDVW